MKPKIKLFIVIGVILVIFIIIILILLSVRKTPTTITVTSNPSGATIDFQDQQYITPYTFTNLAPGHYTLIASKEGHQLEMKAFDVKEHEQQKLSITLKKELADTQTEGAPTTEMTLKDFLPYEDPNFKIEADPKTTGYLITPHISTDIKNLTRDKFAPFWPEYEKNARAAISLIGDYGFDPKTLKLEWWGKDLWPTGKSIDLESGSEQVPSYGGFK